MKRARLLAALTIFLVVCAHGFESVSLEYKVKAAFLLNFARFVEWPPSAFPDASAPIVICIVGEDPFGEQLTRMVADEKVEGRRIEVQHPGGDAAGNCHILYISRSDQEELSTLFSNPRQGVLLVGEGEQFVHRGGAIGFVTENRRVRFDVNMKAASEAGLRFSSKLLMVARSVEK